jgi:2'-5' RNA ligase
MITDYVQDIGGWQEWQKEYRYGVILILPSDPPRQQLNELRAEYDPIGQAICDAHITLTVPLMREAWENDWAELKRIAAEVKPVKVNYGPLSSFLPEYPCIYLEIEPKEKLRDIYSAVESVAVFAGAPPRRYPFVPHMTITEFVGMEQSAETAKELLKNLKDTAPTGYFLCTGLSYMVPDEEFHFTERGRLKLLK